MSSLRAGLRELAEAATAGPWKWEPDDEPEGVGAGFVIPSHDYERTGRRQWWNMLFTDQSKADAAYIAAADPATVLRLLDRLEAAEQALAGLAEWAHKYRDSTEYDFAGAEDAARAARDQRAAEWLERNP